MKIEDVKIGVSKNGEIVLFTINQHKQIDESKKITDEAIDVIGTFMNHNNLKELDFFKKGGLLSRMDISPTLFWVSQPDKVDAIKKILGNN